MQHLLRIFIRRLTSSSIISFIILHIASTSNIIISPAEYLLKEENKAVQSLPGANSPTVVPDVCEFGCMYACMNDKDCYAYTYDATDGSCKTWGHLKIQLVNKPNAKSFFRGIKNFKAH